MCHCGSGGTAAWQLTTAPDPSARVQPFGTPHKGPTDNCKPNDLLASSKPTLPSQQAPGPQVVFAGENRKRTAAPPRRRLLALALLPQLGADLERFAAGACASILTRNGGLRAGPWQSHEAPIRTGRMQCGCQHPGAGKSMSP